MEEEKMTVAPETVEEVAETAVEATAAVKNEPETGEVIEREEEDGEEETPVHAAPKKASTEPLVHLTKRDGVPMRKAVAIRAIAICAALVICALLTVFVTHKNPLVLFSNIVTGAFGKGRLWVTVHNLAILLGISLAVTPAFRMRFWNIGAEGQALAGCLATAIVMFYFHDKMATFPLVMLMIVAALGAGILWGAIPAVFKAYWGTNETLFTLMMNYVAIQLIEWF